MTLTQLKKLLKKRIDGIEQQENAFNKALKRVEKDLFDTIIVKMVSNLDIKDGIIQDTAANINKIANSKVLRQFSNTKTFSLVERLVNLLFDIGDTTSEYFEAQILKSKLDGIKNKIVNDALLSLGYVKTAKSKIKKGGFLESLYLDNSVERRVKKMAVLAIETGQSLKDFRLSLVDTVMGTKDKAGLLKKHFYTHTNDIFSEFDRRVNNDFAEKTEMNEYAIYNGGKMRTTRDFCKTRNGKVYSKKEVLKWDKSSWTGKKKGANILVSLGGYNCRHVLSWITYDLAVQLRPNLKIIK